MVNKIISILTLCIITFVLGFSGCIEGIEEDIENNVEKIQIIDMVGRTVEVPKNVEKIVCSGPGCLRLICYMDSVDKVIGIESFESNDYMGRPYRIANPQFSSLPIIGNGGPRDINVGPDPEKVMTIMPDVIFITYMEAGKADELQRKTGIPVVVLTYGTFGTFENEKVFESFNILGKILEKDKRAVEVSSFIEEVQKDLDERTKDIPESERPSVYVGAIGYQGTQGIDSTEGSYPPLEAVNTKNIAKNASTAHIFISKEKLIEWNPEYIFIDGGGSFKVKEDYNINPDYYNSLDAFKNGNVYLLLPFNHYMTNIGTALADSYYIGKVLYPEEFSDIDPEEKADEIYKFLVGKEVYNVMKEEYGGFKRVDFLN
ncbi:periplasmic binding protein [Methanococcus vannielii SB]|uniref:Periplasmic binding protein n=1 Tax=Methanococcus vannielii (strain ATCC 35089 / DSM 1224 / JCM 13029 / OCM 148 / SB) TaxID=406327 RepID=A6UPI1_METVS|nr:iron ABC transporter substrate-binding protein [Methanococcus vannielii]ABR54403.1 periplasmic binding protein [Methanococcus vannielii SB]